MRVLSLFSGIGGFDLGLERAAKHCGGEAKIGGPLLATEWGYLDKYLGGTAYLHLHFRWIAGRTPTEFPTDYCALAQVLVRPDVVRNDLRLIAETPCDHRVSDSTADGDQATVLIRVFETADQAECPTVRVGTQVIGLRLYDECPDTRISTRHERLKLGLLPLGILRHELTIATASPDILPQDWIASTLAALGGNTRDHDVIECASEVMYEVSEHHRDHRIRLLHDMESVPDLLIALRVVNPDKLVGVSACVGAGGAFDVYHVLLSPFDFEPPRIDWTHGVDSDHEQERTHRADRQTAHEAGRGDSRAHARRVHAEPEESGEGVTSPSPEEVASRTAPVRRRGGCTAKRTHSGSPEDA